MKLENYKNIKKSEWQEIATKFDILWTEDSVVRYLVEKIAEKIGVDDKIVNDNELKKQVVEKINIDFEIIPVKNINSTKPKKNTNKKVVKSKTPVVKEKIRIVKEEEIIVPVLSRLDELRLECETYGIAWAENHTEINLGQVLNGVKQAGILPNKKITELDFIQNNKKTEINSSSTEINSASFEINSSNVDEYSQKVVDFEPANPNVSSNIFLEISKQVLNTQNSNPAFNPLATEQVFFNGGYTNSNAYLDSYKNIYISAIKSHWRLLSFSEINDMILRDTQTFTHQINYNPKVANQIEIILCIDKSSVRIPSDDINEWIEING